MLGALFANLKAPNALSQVVLLSDLSCFVNTVVNIPPIDIIQTFMLNLQTLFLNMIHNVLNMRLLSVYNFTVTEASSTLTPEKFENGVFTLQTHQMFSIHTTPEKFENATIVDGRKA